MVDSKKDSARESKTALKVAVTTCPRCFVDFLCNAANIQQCQCWGVGLAEKEFLYLKSQGFSAAQTGCLCRNCLEEIKIVVQKEGVEKGGK